MRQILKSFVFPYLTLFLVALIIPGACKKDIDYISGADFVNKLEGKYYVETLDAINFDINFVGNTIYYNHSDYNINDPLLCTLPGMEYIQYWTITENNGTLDLTTEDLCGNFRDYTMDYKNYHFVTTKNWRGKEVATDAISAEITLIDTNNTIILDDFMIDMTNRLITFNRDIMGMKTDFYILPRI